MAQLYKILRNMYERNDIFPDLAEGDTKDVLLMYSIFREKDMESVLLSKSYGEYFSRTRDKDPKMKELMSTANISVFKIKLPFNYESNKALHLMLLPQLAKVYDQSRRNLRQAKGVVPYEKALSYVLDKHIFNLTKPYFQEELNKLAILETNRATSTLAGYCKREQLERLFILAEEVKRDLIPEEPQILLSDLVRGKYTSKIREYVPADLDYPGLMLSCPESMKSQPYNIWLSMALKLEGIDLPDIHKESLGEEPIVTEEPKQEEKPAVEEKSVVENPENGRIRFVDRMNQFMNPPEEPIAPSGASTELKQAAWNYAIKLGFNAHIIAGRFADSMSEEDAYKNVPKYILEERGKIDKVGFEEFKKKFC